MKLPFRQGIFIDKWLKLEKESLNSFGLIQVKLLLVDLFFISMYVCLYD